MKSIAAIALHVISMSIAAATASNSTYHTPTLSSITASSTLVVSTSSSAPPVPSSCTPPPGDQNVIVNGGFGNPNQPLANWMFTRAGNANPGIDYSAGSTLDPGNTVTFYVFIQEPGTGQINFTQPVCLTPNIPYRLSYDLGIAAQSNADPGNTGCVVTPFIGDRPQYVAVAPCNDAQAPQDRGDCGIDAYVGDAYYFEFVLAAFLPTDVSDTLLRFVFDCDFAEVDGTAHSVTLDNVALVAVL